MMKNLRILFLLLLISSFLLHCAKKEEIKIGVISPFSGSGAVYGEALKQGFEIALDDIKSSNPVLYSNLKLIYEDDQLNSGIATNAINKLINVDHVPIIIGAFTSNTTLAIAPIAEKNKVVLLTPTATNYKIKFAGDYIFRVCPSDDQQGKVLAEYAIQKLKAKTACILYMNTDYGFGLQESFATIFKKLGGKILYNEGFPQNNTDFRTMIIKIKKLSPDVIYLPSNWQEAANAVNQMKELGLNKQILCTDGTFEPKFLEQTKGSSEGIIITTMAWGVGEEKEIADSFKKKFEKKFKKTPGSYSALCYDALMVVSKVLEKDARTSEEIKNALNHIDYLGATGENRFDKYGEVSKIFQLYTIKNNHFKKR